MLRVTPLRGRVIVQRAPEAVSPSGIIITGTGESKSDKGTVMAVGEGMTFPDGTTRKPIVAVGDEILFGSFLCKLDHEGGTYLVMNEDDILVRL